MLAGGCRMRDPVRGNFVWEWCMGNRAGRDERRDRGQRCYGTSPRESRFLLSSALVLVQRASDLAPVLRKCALYVHRLAERRD